MNSMDLRYASEIDPSFCLFTIDCTREPMCFCIFVFFSSEKDKNTVTKYFFVFFFNNRIAPVHTEAK